MSDEELAEAICRNDVLQMSLFDNTLKGTKDYDRVLSLLQSEVEE